MRGGWELSRQGSAPVAPPPAYHSGVRPDDRPRRRWSEARSSGRWPEVRVTPQRVRKPLHLWRKSRRVYVTRGLLSIVLELHFEARVCTRARPRPRERRCRLVVMGRAERPRGDHLFLRDPLPNNSFAPAMICRRASGTADRAGAALGRPLKHVAPVQRARILTLAAKLLKSSKTQFSSGLRHRSHVSPLLAGQPLR